MGSYDTLCNKTFINLKFNDMVVLNLGKRLDLDGYDLISPIIYAVYEDCGRYILDTTTPYKELCNKISLQFIYNTVNKGNNLDFSNIHTFFEEFQKEIKDSDYCFIPTLGYVANSIHDRFMGNTLHENNLSFFEFDFKKSTEDNLKPYYKELLKEDVDNLDIMESIAFESKVVLFGGLFENNNIRKGQNISIFLSDLFENKYDEEMIVDILLFNFSINYWHVTNNIPIVGNVYAGQQSNQHNQLNVFLSTIEYILVNKNQKYNLKNKNIKERIIELEMDFLLDDNLSIKEKQKHLDNSSFKQIKELNKILKF